MDGYERPALRSSALLLPIAAYLALAMAGRSRQIRPRVRVGGDLALRAASCVELACPYATSSSTTGTVARRVTLRDDRRPDRRASSSTAQPLVDELAASRARHPREHKLVAPTLVRSQAARRRTAVRLLGARHGRAKDSTGGGLQRGERRSSPARRTGLSNALGPDDDVAAGSGATSSRSSLAQNSDGAARLARGSSGCSSTIRQRLSAWAVSRRRATTRSRSTALQRAALARKVMRSYLRPVPEPIDQAAG